MIYYYYNAKLKQLIEANTMQDIQDKHLTELLPAIIFSVDKSGGKDLVDHTSRDYAFKWLKSKGFNYKTVEGKYIGETELSFVVPMDQGNNVHNDCIRLAYEFSQETIITLASTQEGYLWTLTDWIEDTPMYVPHHIGKLTKVDELSQHESYTYDVDNKEYWVIL
jgi:hypothetical protein